MAGYALGFVMGATAGTRFAFYREYLRRRRPASGMRQPEQPLAIRIIRYVRWRDEQIERALRDEPIRK